MFTPKLLTTLKNYNRQQFGSDVIAGLIVGVVALPLAIAFAIASGVGPARGLYTAIVAGFLISALGGSRVQIGGPTGAFVVIVAGIVAKFGVDGLLVATFMAGFMLVLFGLFRLGTAIKFIPYPVVVGFTSGIAVVILSSEVRDFFGLRMETVPADFLERWRAFGHAAPTLNPWALGISLASLAIMIWWPRVSRRIPGPFVALIGVTVLASLFHLPVETIGSRFGVLHAGLPTPSLPHITGAEIKLLIGPAFTIALLGAVESLLSAVVADGMIGGRHRSNMELVAQGIANIASPVFGGIPATGAIARTATNIKNGGRTPVAGRRMPPTARRWCGWTCAAWSRPSRWFARSLRWRHCRQATNWYRSTSGYRAFCCRCWRSASSCTRCADQGRVADHRQRPRSAAAALSDGCRASGCLWLGV